MKQIIKTASELFGIPEDIIGEALAEFMMQEMPKLNYAGITEHIIQDEFIHWFYWNGLTEEVRAQFKLEYAN